MSTLSKEPVRSPDKLKVIVTIVNRSKSEYYADFIQSQGVNVQFFVSAHGTSPKETLDLLGLADDKKSVILGVVPAAKSHDVLTALGERFKTIKNGKGVAFTIPMTSVIGVNAYKLLANIKDSERFF